MQIFKIEPMYNKTNELYIAHSGGKSLYALSDMLNRHGLVTGATGTGKTVTLQTLAETFSDAGIPVFAADIKGDLSGIAKQGGSNVKVEDRVKQLLLDKEGFTYKAVPVCFWDVFGEQGHPIRATVSDMGPFMLSRLLNLNDTQSAVLTMVFKIADDNGLLLLDLKDLRKMLEYVGNNNKEYIANYGNIAPASIGAIQRSLLELEHQGGDRFFGEPAVNIFDFIQVSGGRGVINILAADKLMQSPRVYTTFLLWLLSELFERMPEVGDCNKPKIVFFFDEAHLLFSDAPKALVDKIEQTVKLIRSKGVGIYFVTQNPADIPDSVLGQLGNRVQHALRAYTPNDQKAVRVAAKAFRPNPKIDTEKAITELSVGEALVSFLDEKGAPQQVERAWILPPQSQIGPVSIAERTQFIKESIVYGRYEQLIDRESAYEILVDKIQKQTMVERAAKEQEMAEKVASRRAQRKEKSLTEEILGDVGKTMTRTVTRQISNQIGRSIVRGILGSILGGRQ